ncbi:type IV pilus secretin PilQ [Nitrospira sp. Kam-Ns4a]
MNRPLLPLLMGFAVVLALQSPAACTRLATETKDPIPKDRALDRISVTERPQGVRVAVEGAAPSTYSMSTSLEPPSATLELPGLSKGMGLGLRDINKPPLLQIEPVEVTQPRPGLRLVFHLASPVEPEVRTEGPDLLVEFPKPPEPQAGQAAAEESAAKGSQANPPTATGGGVTAEGGTGAAKTMTHVDVQRGDGGIRVIILGDGSFRYEVRPLGRDRLVIDLPNVETPLRFQTLPVDHPLLKQIRIGQHSRRVRLVLDLLRPSDYTVERGDGSLTVRLAASSDRAVAEAGKRGKLEPDEADGSQADETGTREKRAPRAVPFPDRLARIEGKVPRAQMAPEAKGAVEGEEAERPRYTGRKISLDFQGADITNVVRSIAEVSGDNFVMGEGVKDKKVTMKLINVPWDQALDMLLKMNNLGKIKEGNIIWIDSLANIARQQEEEAKAKESKIKAEDLETRVLYVQNVPVQEIHRSLQQYLSPRGQITFNTASNALIIKDTRSQLEDLFNLARSLDLEVPQVQIEARIVQADTTYARSLGIQWGLSNLNTTKAGVVANIRGQGTTTTNPFGEQASQFLVNLPAQISGLSAVPGLGFTYGKLTGDGALLDLRLTAAEQLGLAKVVAAPKILTLDKREAKIEQGQSVPYQTTSLQGTQTTFVDAVLSLQVTPQITSRDPKEVGKQILLKIKATRNSIGAQSTPAGPAIDKKEALTQILVRDGETAVVGGIFQDQVQNTVIGIPWLSRIPVLGWLFKSKQETTTKNELLIFLTPTIVKS